jgi:hypothetical protein
MEETRANVKPKETGEHDGKQVPPTININGQDYYVDDVQKKLIHVDHPEISIRLPIGRAISNKEHTENKDRKRKKTLNARIIKL